MESYKKLLLGNNIWAKEKTLHNPAFFQDLAKDQRPEFLWIGCSDSRVPAEEITGARPGELFVHRNVANLVTEGDLNLLSVLHFSVNVLKVRHVIVCGHYGCGGIAGALTHSNLGLLEAWLAPLRAQARTHQQELEALVHEHDRINALAKMSVLKQIDNLAKTSVIQEAWHHDQRPVLHGWIYNIGTGLIEPLTEKSP